MKRSGLITTKIGMTRLYDDGGVAHAVTVLSVGDCTVIGNRTTEKNGYVANILGLREAKAKHVAKPQAKAAEKAGVKPYRKVVEFRVSDDCVIPVGTQLSAAHFIAGQYVDVQNTTWPFTHTCTTQRTVCFQNTVRCFFSAKVMTFHSTLETFTFARCLNIDILTGNKMCGR